MPLDLNEKYLDIDTWPFKEAKKLAKDRSNIIEKKDFVLFETGYGPSGLPHIGTFAEVARTSMVAHAFEALTSKKTKIFAFSDDMDGLRKIPDNIPNPEILRDHLHKPLTKVPDPFKKYKSFGEHNNKMLQEFLNKFNFDYEFQSATSLYKAGKFDNVLCQVLEKYDSILEVILPTLRSERRKTYSPFLPICEKTGKVLEVPILHLDRKNKTIVYKDEYNKEVEVSVLSGKCKLQWKVDWAMRWVALDVDYEMYGKDLIPSMELSSKICKILSGKSPNGFSYELFLDENGEKISKSRGNGISVEQWLRYAPLETLMYYKFVNPRRAKKLYFDVIPKTIDEYISHLNKYQNQGHIEKISNPVWSVHRGQPPEFQIPISFSLLLNLVGASNSENSEVLWGFVSEYSSQLKPNQNPFFDRLILLAITYYHELIKPKRKYKKPNENEKEMFRDLIVRLKKISKNATSEEIQSEVYEVGKKYKFENLRLWFQLIYEVLFGENRGPRMGTFISIFGIEKTIQMIEEKIN